MPEMQLVRFLGNVAAPEGSYTAGERALLLPELAKRWEEQGLIEKVTPVEVPETASVEAEEKAVPSGRSGRARGRQQAAED